MGNGGGILKDWIIETLSDPSFMGALLGALITGFIAICIMKITLKTEHKRTKRLIIEEFIKEAIFFYESTKELLETTTGYAEYQKEEENTATRVDKDGFPTEEISEIKFGKEILEKDMLSSLAKVKTVNRKYFTYDSIIIYININNTITNTIEYFWERSMNNSLHGVADFFFSAIENIEDELEKLKEIIEINKRKIK